MAASDWSRLRDILRLTSFRAETEEVIRLSSGRMSRFYVDCKKALSYPEARLLIARLVLEKLPDIDSFDTIGGLEIGAYPIATAVSDEIYSRHGQSKRVFIVRKKEKGHGIPGVVAGDVQKGDRAIIVDDVITTGQSTITAINGAREAGFVVDRAIVIVDRDEEQGRQNIEAVGVTCAGLCTLADLQGVERRATTDGTTYSTGLEQAKSA